MDDSFTCKKWVMHYIYEAYTKEVNGVVHYFVKRYLCFPELNQVPDLMEGFGMHQDFYKACHIAGVADQQQINLLFAQVNQPAEAAKVIDMMALNAQAELRSNAI